MKGALKMKKNFKILSLVLSMLLIVGAAVGISVSADNDPRVEITAKNIAYEGAVKTLYVVDTENADGLTVKVDFYGTNPAEGGELLYSKGVGNTITLDEVEYDVVFSEGFRPKDLRDSLFVVPTLVDADGNVVATGATVEYSPYIYSMNRFTKGATADQVALYTALLDYGAAVQRVLSTPEEIAACGGYADEYYDVTVNGALATAIDTKTVQIKDTFSKAEIEAGAITANAKLDDIDFIAWADVDGNAIRLATSESSATFTADELKPGRTALTAVYGGYGVANYEKSDFTNGNPWGFIERTQNIATVPENASVKLVNANYPGTSSLTTADGKLIYNKISTPKEEFGDNLELWGGCNYQWFEVWFNGVTFDVLSAEFDVTFTNVTGTGNFQLAITDTLPRLYMAPSAEKDENGYSTYVTAGTAKLYTGETYKLRVDWCSETCTFNAFVDGELVYTTKKADADKYEKFNTFKFIADAGLSANVVFDNLATNNLCVHNNVVVNDTNPKAAAGDGKLYNICAKCSQADTSYAYERNNRGNGTYYNDTTFAGTRYDMSKMPTRYYKNGSGQTWEIVDGALAITSSAWAPMSIRPEDGTMTAVAGQKYVVEFDLMYSGIGAEKGDYVFAGLAYAEKGTNNTQSPSFYWGSVQNEYLTLGNNNVAIGNGVWFNFRYEYTVNADGTADYVTYVNNEAISALSGNVATAIAESYGWSICGRAAGDQTVNLDNMYLGVVCLEHSFANANHHDANAYLGNGEFREVCTECGKLGDTYSVTANGGAFFNDENATGAKVDIDNTSLNISESTGDKGLTFGEDNGSYKLVSSAYDVITMTPGGRGLSPLPGEKVIIEFDYCYEGRIKNGTAEPYGFFGIAGSSLASNGNFACSKYSTINFYENYSTIYPFGSSDPKNIHFLKGVWYNLRYEYLLNNDNTFTLTVYVDDAETPFYTKTSDVVKGTIYGFSFQGRNDGGNVTTVRFDNFYMGVEAAEIELGTGAYYADDTKDGQKVDFTGATNYTTGEGNVLGAWADGTKQKFFSIRQDPEDAANTVLNFTPTGWGYGLVSANPNAGDGTNANVTPVTVKVGDTLVAEFDFRYNGVNFTTSTVGTPQTSLKFEFNTKPNGSENNHFGNQIALNVDTANFNYIYFTNAGTRPLYKDEWYNIRFEYTIGTGGSIYINGVKATNLLNDDKLNQDTTETTWYGMSIIARSYCANIDFDNFYMGVIPAAN